MVMDPSRLAAAARSDAADLVEIFSSIQGEGPRAGERHLFVRFSHCDMHCAYCDTPLCHLAPAEARIESPPGSRSWRRLRNPVPLVELGRILADEFLAQAPHRAVSFTGGEPLLQPWAIRHLAPALRDRGVLVLLETDGNLPDALAGIIDAIDVVSMDWKLPSATREPLRLAEHRRFIEIARNTETYVKLVFVEETPVEEVVQAAQVFRELRPSTPFVLQPCTPFRDVARGPSPETALRLHAAASEYLADVRVLPQIHRFLGVA